MGISTIQVVGAGVAAAAVAGAGHMILRNQAEDAFQQEKRDLKHWGSNLNAEFPEGIGSSSRPLKTAADHARFNRFIEENVAPGTLKVKHTSKGVYLGRKFSYRIPEISVAQNVMLGSGLVGGTALIGGLFASTTKYSKYSGVIAAIGAGLMVGTMLTSTMRSTNGVQGTIERDVWGKK